MGNKDRLVSEKEIKQYKNRIYLSGHWAGCVLENSYAEVLGERPDSRHRMYELRALNGTLIFYSFSNEGVPDFENVKEPAIHNVYFVDKLSEINKIWETGTSKEAFQEGTRVIEWCIAKAKRQYTERST